jgi:hypothetical protein
MLRKRSMIATIAAVLLLLPLSVADALRLLAGCEDSGAFSDSVVFAVASVIAPVANSGVSNAGTELPVCTLSAGFGVTAGRFFGTVVARVFGFSGATAISLFMYHSGLVSE